MANTYEIGNQPILRCEFTDADGVATDPTDVSCFVRVGDTTTEYAYGTDPEIEKVSTGIYTCTITITEVGTHHYRFTGEGALVAADESFFKVRQSAFD